MSQSNEFLLNNALAEDFQQMLRPFYLTQRLLCASKYIIKDSFVLPNSKAYCAVKVLVLCFIIYAYFAVSLETPCTMENQCPLITGSQLHNIYFCQYSCDVTNSDRMDEVGDGVSRNVTKNVLRLCDVRFSKMRVCGLFTADAALPLRLMSLIATYCIVLLQFAFL
ncbi:hypothetical protein EVAR_83516_1 [Eumeta japonica]|uniref:Gustatory receptor n=1 Tax=Eumeta variegata TaxID=151549 RepID=A0A4C1Y069_EUMVA|nr:hypothetical protein EVAR_83516_1 [Eumeta japonica]